jgi:hypothetical protein
LQLRQILLDIILSNSTQYQVTCGIPGLEVFVAILLALECVDLVEIAVLTLRQSQAGVDIHSRLQFQKKLRTSLCSADCDYTWLVPGIPLA